jgi:hypothetical protein
MNKKTAYTLFIGCKWVDLKRCKWYEFRKKLKIKKQMKEICKKADIILKKNWKKEKLK